MGFNLASGAGSQKITSENAWWWLSREQKQELRRQRQAGRFGGANAAAVGRAPYIWSQEYGNEKAMIAPHGFLRDITDAFSATIDEKMRVVFDYG